MYSTYSDLLSIVYNLNIRLLRKMDNDFILRVGVNSTSEGSELRLLL